MAQGVDNVREYLSECYQGSRASPVWADLWTLGTSIDFRLGMVTSELELMQVLSEDDSVELGLRRIASFVFESDRRQGWCGQYAG